MAKKRRFRSRGFLFKVALIVTLIFSAFVIYLDATVRYRFREGQWQEPAKVFAQSVIFQRGGLMVADDVEKSLLRLGYQYSSTVDTPGTMARRGGEFEVYRRAFSVADQQQQSERFYIRIEEDVVVGLHDAEQKVLAQVALEPQSIGSLQIGNTQDRWLTRLEDTPELLVSTLLLVEDRNFYKHLGVSARAIARAFSANAKAGKVVQGGSTLTQQLVKNMFLTPRRNFSRKFREALMAILLELHFEKHEILETYTNEVYLGQAGKSAVHGFGLASQHYFSQPLHELSPGQMALLVGLIKGPSYYDPWRFPDRAKQRRNVILELMHGQQWILDADLQRFREMPLGLSKASARSDTYPAYLDLIKRQLRRDYSDEVLRAGGLHLYTALDTNVQHHAEQSLRTVVESFQETQDQLQGAMVVLSTHSGEVLAMVGDRKPRYAGFNRALDAVRPIGSLVKPAVYLTGILRGDYHLATVLQDEPVSLTNEKGDVWQPKNFDEQSHGDVLFYDALAKSYNQATAHLGMDLGVDQVAATLQRLGLVRPFEPLPALLLGAVELSPYDVARLYQALASRGQLLPMRSLLAVEQANGEILARYPRESRRVLNEQMSYLMTFNLVMAMQEGTGRSIYQSIPKDIYLAGKTGTSNDYRDSWVVGFSGDYLVVVWLGNDDNASTGLTGSKGALKVWQQFLARVAQQSIDLSPPDNIAMVAVNARGERSGRACGEVKELPFIFGSEPTVADRCGSTKVPKVLRWFERLFNR